MAAQKALERLKVIDLSDESGQLCGRVLADLGADVIKVESPGGDKTRSMPPHFEKSPGPATGILFQHFNLNKRGLTLDLENPRGRDTLIALFKSSDVVVETFSPGYLAKLGLQFDALSALNPRLILCSVTGFGQTGPYNGLKASDGVCQAMSGMLYTFGLPDKPPLPLTGFQMFQIAALTAAFGVLIALHDREKTGLGQHVDVSAVEIGASLFHRVVNYSANSIVMRRFGPKAPTFGSAPQGFYKTKDGYLYTSIIVPSHWQTFKTLIGSPEVVADPIWDNRHFRAQNADVIEPFASRFAASHTNQEIAQIAAENHLLMAPVYKPSEFLNDPQVKTRDLFLQIETSKGQKSWIMRPPYISPGGGSYRPRRAPNPDEHRLDILAALDSSKPESHTDTIEALNRAASEQQDRKGRGLPLSGVRVLDLTMVIAGPTMTRLLAEFGAEVIRVESSTHPQRGRFNSALPRSIYVQQKVTYADMNRNKKSVTINMDSKEGLDIFGRLATTSDVVVTGVTSRVLDKWRLHYDDLRKKREDIIVAHLTGYGTTGPYRSHVSNAVIAAAFTGMYSLWSYEDGNPVGATLWHPDYALGVSAAIAVLAALRRRKLSGQGAYLDIAQLDASAFLIAPAYLSHLQNGHWALPSEEYKSSPYGCFPCWGKDRWCFISVSSDEEWQGLCKAVGNPTWANDQRFSSEKLRVVHRAELDELLARWTVDYTPRQVMRMLQAEGVPAGAVLEDEEIFHDIHLRSRGFFHKVFDPEIGNVEYPRVPMKLSKLEPQVGRCPELGEDNDYVFGEILKLPRKEIQSLIQKGVLV